MSDFFVDISFSEDYFKKLGVKGDEPYITSLDEAVKHTIHDAENTCRREAPIRTGYLRRSIHKHKKEKCRAELRTRARYWAYVNFGTSKQSANPFVIRTAKKVSPKLKKYFEENLKQSRVLN